MSRKKSREWRRIKKQRNKDRRNAKNIPNPSLVVDLLDENQQLLCKITRADAGVFVKQSLGRLLLSKPPAIILDATNQELNALGMNLENGVLSRIKPHWEHYKVKQKRNTVHYGNYTVYSPDGLKLNTASANKVMWYLYNDLADVVSASAIRLKFIPKGDGDNGDEFYMQQKANECVCCGKKTGLTVHHIVPDCYRHYLPILYKDHNSHDIVLLCWKSCHKQYEYEALKLKKIIADENNCSINGRGQKLNRDIFKPKSFANALLYHDNIPVPRKTEITEWLKKFTGKENLTEQDLIDVMELPTVDFSDYVPYGKIIADTLDTDEKLTQFVRRWRQHFIDTVKPKFMPKHWSVDRPIYRDKDLV